MIVWNNNNIDNKSKFYILKINLIKYLIYLTFLGQIANIIDNHNKKKL